MAELFTEEEVRAELRDRIGEMSIRQWAKQNGITAQQVEYFLNGKRSVEPKLLEVLGFRRKILYEAKENR